MKPAYLCEKINWDIVTSIVLHHLLFVYDVTKSYVRLKYCSLTFMLKAIMSQRVHILSKWLQLVISFLQWVFCYFCAVIFFVAGLLFARWSRMEKRIHVATQLFGTLGLVSLGLEVWVCYISHSSVLSFFPYPGSCRCQCQKPWQGSGSTHREQEGSDWVGFGAFERGTILWGTPWVCEPHLCFCCCCCLRIWKDW